MISVNEFRTGLTIELDGDLYQVVEFLHVKPGKGAAFVRSKLKNIKTGYTLEKTFRGGEKIQRAHIEHRKMQFTYEDDGIYHFMDMESYEDVGIDAGLLGDQKQWLKDGMEVEVSFHEEVPFGIEVPNFVELVVTETEPGFKGDTATGATKPATLETGAVVNVPLFIEIGTKLQIDTRTGQYLRRVN
ncbi:MAG: elongation factor P [bacterium]|nr:elongation factor P [bacterium]